MIWRWKGDFVGKIYAIVELKEEPEFDGYRTTKEGCFQFVGAVIVNGIQNLGIYERIQRNEFLYEHEESLRLGVQG